jgi:putative secretion ATPase (PEP-CTERM system associated)
MYEKFYRFTGMPFQLTPDSRFFFSSAGHSRAIAHLIYGLSQGEGFIIVTGEVGAGKTTLVERLWAELDRDVYTIARISTSQISGSDLFRLAMAGFGLEPGTDDKATLLGRFDTFLADHRAANRRCLLVVDEVQNLSLEALEELRMLSNLTGGGMTADGHAVLQTILLGQPQFRRKLASPDLDQLRQRVLASYHLGPLSAEETQAYIQHRLLAVGWTGNPAWTDAAYAAVFRHTGGIPRRINRLCSRTLLYGAIEESNTITGAMVDNTANELHNDIEGTADLPSVPPPAIAGGVSLDALALRLEALEEAVAKREKVFQRLMDVFGGFAAARN